MTIFSCRFISLLLLSFVLLGYSNTTVSAQVAKKARVVSVVSAPIQRQVIQSVIEAVGTTKANQSVRITALSSGVVREILFREGQQVARGDVLVRLDDDIERADLAEARARLAEAQKALERSRSLRKRDAVAESAVEKLIAELEVARAERDRAVRKLADRTLTAPFAGKIGFSDIEVGSYLQANEAVATLDDLSKVMVEFYLSEKRYGQVHIGTDIRADAAAFSDRTFVGQITAIDTRINADTRSFRVRALVDNKDGVLPAGMFMHLGVILDGDGEGLVVPEEAVTVSGSEASVFVVVSQDEAQIVQRRTVVLGRRIYGGVEVLSGVKEGEEVIVRGIQKVRPGSEVKVQGSSAAQGAK